LKTALLAAILIFSSFAAADTIQNGGFEQGLTGWTVTSVDNGAFNYYYLQDNSGAAALSGVHVMGAAAGAQYALSDSIGAGIRSISQNFTAPSVSKIILSFDMFVNHDANVANDHQGLASTEPLASAGPAQQLWNGGVGPVLANNYATVDILAAGTDPLGNAVLQNFFLGVTGSNFQINGWRHYSFDVTGLLTPGQQYEIRFADVAGVDYLQTGVDNVSIGPVPEPTSLLLLGTGLVAGGVLLKRRSASSLTVKVRA
jgi:hypothetical protein